MARPRSPAADTEWEMAIGRAAIYGFIARCLLFPTPESSECVGVELLPLLDGLSSNSATLDVRLAEALDAYPTDLDEFRWAHSRIFTHIESRDCPAHETAYHPGDVFRRADVMADVAAFYRAHGLAVGGSRRERVDHITTELEFLSFLARKEAYAIQNLGADEIEECRRSQKHFLRDHVGCWAPGFASRLGVVGDHPFFAAVGSLLSLWIHTDLEWFGVAPATRLTEPQPLPPPEDDGCGIDISESTITPVEIRR